MQSAIVFHGIVHRRVEREVLKELAGLDYSGESFVVGERLRLAPCGRRQQSVQRFIVQLNRIALAFHR